MPSRSRIPVRKSAALCVSPGGLDVSMRTYSVSSRVSSSRLLSCAAAIGDKDTEVPAKDTKEKHTMAVRQRFIPLCPLFFPFVSLAPALYRLEHSGLTIFFHTIPHEAAPVHRDVDARREHLRERQRAAQIEQPV